MLGMLLRATPQCPLAMLLLPLARKTAALVRSATSSLHFAIRSARRIVSA
jgi:hypothetical protein